ncbi:BlaI/MecI/CopY family transcriptional regulator [Catellatospora tritici]|uniref:BlaI/MecI/CopY family transcriptional regulator n=1 Tax=Catellatospora tritici TaxID=2851566 RepID=UPI001C2D3048|nr:BlaI/MecI/CopY family transcriptional regulator [Catellatospora tritici]MBV1853697.1 BlaI/MecI/CopY family transcriptional regulator [Catellatospora tritici]
MTDTDGRKRAAGELEAEVMAVLWAAGGPMTPAQVQARLEPGLAYNTVQTILTRLADKRLVSRTQVGRAHAYQPVLDEAASAAARLRATLDASGDPALVLRRFAESLDSEEARLLRELLRTQVERP